MNYLDMSPLLADRGRRRERGVTGEQKRGEHERYAVRLRMIERVKNSHGQCTENAFWLDEHVPTVKPEKPPEIDPETGKGSDCEHKPPTDELATPLAHPLVHDPKRHDTEKTARQRERQNEPRV